MNVTPASAPIDDHPNAACRHSREGGHPETPMSESNGIPWRVCIPAPAGMTKQAARPNVDPA